MREELQQILSPVEGDSNSMSAQETQSTAAASTLMSGEQERKRALYNMLMADTAPYKCFLRMKMEGLYRDVSSIY